MRNEFCSSLKDFLSADYLPEIIARLDEMADFIDEETINLWKDNLSYDFDMLKVVNDDYFNLKDEIEPL